MSPSEVRRAVPDDVGSLLEMLTEMGEETGLYPFAPGKVLQLLQGSFSGLNPTIIGAIGPVGAVEASIGLLPAQPWYTESYHVGDVWNYVRRDFRVSGHAASLIEFGKDIANKTGLDFISGVTSADRTEAKMRLYRRHFDTCLGGLFLHRCVNGK